MINLLEFLVALPIAVVLAIGPVYIVLGVLERRGSRWMTGAGHAGDGSTRGSDRMPQ